MSNALSYLFQEDLYTIPPHKFAIVLPKPWDQYSQDEKNLLAKILGSVKLDLASVRIIQASAISMESIAALNAPRVLVFGADLEGVNTYENRVAQGFSVIKADDLSALDDARKKSLWMALRGMFGI